MALQINQPHTWYMHDISGKAAMDAATVDVLGLFLVPVRTLFGFETAEEVRLELVTSLDGAESYCPGEKITLSRLRVFADPLKAFANSIQLDAEKSRAAVQEWSDAEKEAMRQSLANGLMQTAVGKLHGITRQRVAELVNSLKIAAPTANNPFPVRKRNPGR